MKTRIFVALAVLMIWVPRGTMARTINFNLDPRFGHQVERFVFQSLLPYDQENFQIDGQTLSLECYEIPVELCDAFAQLNQESSTLNTRKLLSLWQNHFLETRVHRGNERIMLDTLHEFHDIVPYTTWASRVVNSRVKNGQRRIFRGFVQGRQMSVAETLGSQGEVREVEVAFERIHQPGNFEFYTYDGQGNMVLESEFPNGMREAPRACMGCHINRDGYTSRFIPDL